jgi:NADH-quinone oxidoreductase subunit L
MITFVCGLIHIYAVGYMRDDSGYVRFFALLNSFVAAMLTLEPCRESSLSHLKGSVSPPTPLGFWYQDAAEPPGVEGSSLPASAMSYWGSPWSGS